MAIGDGFRARRLADRAHERYRAAGWSAAEAEVTAAPARLAAEAWAQLGVALENAERTDDARRALLRSRALAPARTDTLLFLAELEADAGNHQVAIGLFRELLAAAPRAATQALDLARLLAATGGANARDEIIQVLTPFANHTSIELRVMLARAMYAAARYADVVAVVGPVIKDAELELGSLTARNLRAELTDHLRNATHLHDEAYAALHGREQVIEADIHRGRLVANSGANYRLLGEARMAVAPAWKPETTLRDLDATAAFGQSLIAAGERLRGLCHVGLAALRRHRPSEARRLFEQARDVDEGNFAAFLGIAAAIDHDKTGAVGRIGRLPEAPATLSPGLAQVLVDWPALTPSERVVVHAAVAPLAHQFGTVAAAGAIARVLPIDARLVDLPQFSDGGGERMDDARCLDAITGAATRKVCASKSRSC